MWVLRRWRLDGLWVERVDGDIRIIPAEWTALHPRSPVSCIEGRPALLTAAAMRELAAWIGTRAGAAEGDPTAGT